ncbi:hypothetical protein V8E36_008404 [Tilletia maclaganii]
MSGPSAFSYGTGPSSMDPDGSLTPQYQHQHHQHQPQTQHQLQVPNHQHFGHTARSDMYSSSGGAAGMYLPQHHQSSHLAPGMAYHHQPQASPLQHSSHPSAAARLLSAEPLDQSMSPYHFAQPSPIMGQGQQQMNAMHSQVHHHHHQQSYQHQPAQHSHAHTPSLELTGVGASSVTPHGGMYIHTPVSATSEAQSAILGPPSVMQHPMDSHHQTQSAHHLRVHAHSQHQHDTAQGHHNNAMTSYGHTLPGGAGSSTNSGMAQHSHPQHTYGANSHASPLTPQHQLYPPPHQSQMAYGGGGQHHQSQMSSHLNAHLAPFRTHPAAISAFASSATSAQQQPPIAQPLLPPPSSLSLSSGGSRHLPSGGGVAGVSDSKPPPLTPSGGGPAAAVLAESKRRQRASSNVSKSGGVGGGGGRGRRTGAGTTAAAAADSHNGAANGTAGSSSRSRVNTGAGGEGAAIGSSSGAKHAKAGSSGGGGSAPKGRGAAAGAAAAAEADAAANGDAALTTVTIFQCRGFPGCNMTFSRSEHLARHVRKHTGERPFPCHCGKAFSRLDNLRQHAQTVHSDTPEKNESMMSDLVVLHANLAASAAQMQHAHMQVSNKVVLAEERDAKEQERFGRAPAPAPVPEAPPTTGKSKKGTGTGEKATKKEGKARKGAAAAADTRGLQPVGSSAGASRQSHALPPPLTSQQQQAYPYSHLSGDQSVSQTASMLMQASPALSAISGPPPGQFVYAPLSQPAMGQGLVVGMDGHPPGGQQGHAAPSPIDLYHARHQQPYSGTTAMPHSETSPATAAFGSGVPTSSSTSPAGVLGVGGEVGPGYGGGDTSASTAATIATPLSAYPNGSFSSSNGHGGDHGVPLQAGARTMTPSAGPLSAVSQPGPNFEYFGGTGPTVSASAATPAATLYSTAQNVTTPASALTPAPAAETNANLPMAAAAQQTSTPAASSNAMVTPVFTGGSGGTTGSAAADQGLGGGRRESAFSSLSSYHTFGGPPTGGTGPWSSASTMRNSSFGDPLGPGVAFSASATGPGGMGAMGAGGGGGGGGGGAGPGEGGGNPNQNGEYDDFWYNMDMFVRERAKSQSHSVAYQSGLLSALQMRNQAEGGGGAVGAGGLSAGFFGGERRISRAVTPPPPGSSRGERPVSASGRPSSSSRSRPASARQSFGTMMGNVVPFGRRPSSSAGLMGFLGMPGQQDFSLFGSTSGPVPTSWEIPSIEEHLAATSESVAGNGGTRQQGRPFTPSVARQVLQSSDGRSGSVFGGLGTRIRTGSRDLNGGSSIGPLGERRLSRPSLSLDPLSRRPTTGSNPFDPSKLLMGFLPPGSGSGRTGSRASLIGGGPSLFSSSFSMERGRPSSSSGAMPSAVVAAETAPGASGAAGSSQGSGATRLPGLAHRLNTAGSDLRTSPPAASPFMFQPPPVGGGPAGKDTVAPILPPLATTRPTSSSRRPLGSMSSLFSAPTTAEPIVSAVLPALRLGKRAADSDKGSDVVSKEDSERHAPRARNHSPATNASKASDSESKAGGGPHSAAGRDDGSVDDARLLLQLSSRGSIGDGSSLPAKPFGATDASFSHSNSALHKSPRKRVSSDDDQAPPSISSEPRLSIASLLGPTGPDVGSRPGTSSGAPPAPASASSGTRVVSPVHAGTVVAAVSPKSTRTGTGLGLGGGPEAMMNAGGKMGAHGVVPPPGLGGVLGGGGADDMELSPKSVPPPKFLDRSAVPAPSG